MRLGTERFRLGLKHGGVLVTLGSAHFFVRFRHLVGSGLLESLRYALLRPVRDWISATLVRQSLRRGSRGCRLAHGGIL